MSIQEVHDVAGHNPVQRTPPITTAVDKTKEEITGQL